MFQVVNEAFNTLSVPELRAEYDGLFRMRCVLEQGSLTEARLQAAAKEVAAAAGAASSR